MTRSPTRLAGAAIILIASVAVGRAGEKEIGPVHSFPYWSGTVSTKLGGDRVFDVANATPSQNLAKFSFEANTALHFSEAFSLNTHLTAEPVLDPAPFADHYFSDEGLYVEELFAQHESNGWRAAIGKFDLVFGLAPENAPGVFGTEYAEDYQMKEKLGAALAYTFDAGPEGKHTITASLYRSDTSPLAGSVYTKRHRLSLEDGGAGNTHAPRSFVVSLASEDVPALQGLGYSFAFRHQAQGAGPDDTAAENAGVFGLMKSFDIAKDRALQAIVETAYLSHAGGGPDDLAYLTTGAKLTDGPWNTSASWTMRKTLVADGANYSDDLYQISAGYLFEDGTSLDGGYKYVHQSSGDVQAVRLQVKHEFSF